MNNTASIYSDAAWSKLEVLSTMRRFIENELDHSKSFPAGFSSEKLEQALRQIDGFSAEFSRFLSLKNNHSGVQDLEIEFDELSNRYAMLMQDIEVIVGN